MKRFFYILCISLLAFSCSKELEQQQPVEGDIDGNGVSRSAVSTTTFIVGGYIGYNSNSICVDKHGNCYYYDWSHPQFPFLLSKVDAITSDIIGLFTLPKNTESIAVDENGRVFASLGRYNGSNHHLVRYDPDKNYQVGRDYSPTIKAITGWSDFIIWSTSVDANNNVFISCSIDRTTRTPSCILRINGSNDNVVKVVENNSYSSQWGMEIHRGAGINLFATDHWGNANGNYYHIDITARIATAYTSGLNFDCAGAAMNKALLYVATGNQIYRINSTGTAIAKLTEFDIPTSIPLYENEGDYDLPGGDRIMQILPTPNANAFYILCGYYSNRTALIKVSL